MKKTIKLNANETYFIINKDSSIIIIEPTDKKNKIETRIITPLKINDYNLLASNIAIAILQKIKMEKSFINNILNWFRAVCISAEDVTVH